MLSKNVKTADYKEGDYIIRQGEEGDSFYIIARGECSVVVNHCEVATLGPNKFFGEKALLTKDKRNASVVATCDTTCLVLDRSDFQRLLGPLEAIIKQHSASVATENSERLGADSDEAHLMSFAKRLTRRMSTAKGSAGSARAHAQSKYANSKFQLDLLFRTRLLGSGTFSQVFQAQHTGDGRSYALKCMRKQPLFEQEQGRAALRERELMHAVEHPFINNFYATMQVHTRRAPSQLSVCLYIVCLNIVCLTACLTACLSVCLSNCRKHRMRTACTSCSSWCPVPTSGPSCTRRKANEEPTCRACPSQTCVAPNPSPSPNPNLSLRSAQVAFYSAVVLSVLTYLHDQDIIFRDVKPENFVLHSSGYLKLIDFGCAKKLTAGVTNTMCGCPMYLAPEVVLSKGHHRSYDLWQYGIFIYELLTRSTPFENDNMSMMYQSIVECDDKLDGIFDGLLAKSGTRSNKKYRSAVDLVRRLVVYGPNKRIGVLRGGMAEVFEHRFFKDHSLSITNINNRSHKPPFLPADDDMSLIDVNYEDCEAADADAPEYTGSFDFSHF